MTYKLQQVLKKVDYFTLIEENRLELRIDYSKWLRKHKGIIKFKKRIIHYASDFCHCKGYLILPNKLLQDYLQNNLCFKCGKLLSSKKRKERELYLQGYNVFTARLTRMGAREEDKKG